MNNSHPEDLQWHESDLQECCDRIAELEAALRESTELMCEYNEIDWAEDKELSGRIAANERLLGGNNDG